MIVPEVVGDKTVLHFVENVKEFTYRDDPELWNRILRHICTTNKVYDGKDFRAGAETFVVKADEITDINFILDYLYDDLRFKKYATIMVTSPKFKLCYRKHFRRITINDKDYMSVGYIILPSEVAKQFL